METIYSIAATAIGAGLILYLFSKIEELQRRAHEAELKAEDRDRKIADLLSIARETRDLLRRQSGDW